MQRSKRIRPLDVEEQPSLGQSVSRNSIEGLLIILPFVCEYVQVYEQFNLAHVCKEFNVIMRERPAAQRTIDLAELCRYEAFYSQHLPYFCCIRDVDYVVRTVLKTKDKALRESWKPLWLLGGLHCLGSRMLESALRAAPCIADTLSCLVIEQAEMSPEIWRHFPPLKSLAMVKCEIKLYNQHVLKMPRVKELKLDVCKCSIDGVKLDPAAVAANFGQDLEKLKISGVELFQDTRPKVSLRTLSILKGLKELELCEVNFYEVVLHNQASLEHEQGHVQQPECLLDLPLLEKIDLTRILNFDLEILRPCKNLHTFSGWYDSEDLNESVALRAANRRSQQWHLTALPKLKEIGIGYMSSPEDVHHDKHHHATTKLLCNRNAGGEVVSVDVVSIFSLNSYSFEFTQQFENRAAALDANTYISHLYEHGFLGDDVGASFIRIKELKCPLCLPYNFINVLHKCSNLENLWVELNPLRRTNGDMFRSTSGALRLEHETYPCKELTLKYLSNRSSKMLSPIFSRMRLKSFSLKEDPKARWGRKYDYSWLAASVLTLESLDIEGWNPRYRSDPTLVDHAAILSFTNLLQICLTQVQLRPIHVKQIGSLPQLELFVLKDALLFPPVENASEDSPTCHDLFPSLRRLSLYDLSVEASQDQIPFQQILQAKQLRTLTFITILPIRDVESFVPATAHSLVQNVKLNECVELDLSGCNILPDLEGINAPLLERLVVNGCSNLESLNGISTFRRLRILSTMGCSALRNTEALMSLDKLQVVIFQDCKALTIQSFEFVRRAELLRYLNIVGCNTALSTEDLALMMRVKDFVTIVHAKITEPTLGHSGVLFSSHAEKHADMLLNANSRSFVVNTMNLENLKRRS